MSLKKRLSRRSFLQMVSGATAAYLGSSIGANSAFSQGTDADANDQVGYVAALATHDS